MRKKEAFWLSVSLCCLLKKKKKYQGFHLHSRFNINTYLIAVSLITVDVGNASTRISRFANYLRNLLPSSDIVVMEMAAKAVGRLALASGTYAAEYVEFEVKRAFEWLSGDRHEGRRHAAVCIDRYFNCNMYYIVNYY